MRASVWVQSFHLSFLTTLPYLLFVTLQSCNSELIIGECQRYKYCTVQDWCLLVTLNYAFSSNRLVTLSCKVLKILMPAKYMHFWKYDRLAFGLRGWSLFLILIQRTDEAVLKFFQLFTIKFINENIHWHGTSKISISLNRLLHDVPGFAPTIILTTFFYEVHLL